MGCDVGNRPFSRTAATAEKIYLHIAHSWSQLLYRSISAWPLLFLMSQINATCFHYLIKDYLEVKWNAV